MYNNFTEKVTAVSAILPVITAGDGTVTSVAIDRAGYLSGAVVYHAGICPSVPTGFTVALAVTHCDTSGGTYTNFATIATFGAADDLSAASTIKYFDVNLRGAKRYIKITETFDFTGGSSPSQLGSVSVVLGDAKSEPVGSTTVYGS
jgi:hypothetical protein